MAHHQPVRSKVRSFAKTMREHPTDAEATMWRLLRNRRLLQFKFRRQAPFQGCILDFVCFDQKLVVEVDGSQHASETDQARTACLRAEGFQVARYWNNEVLQNPTAVLDDILARLGRLS